MGLESLREQRKYTYEDWASWDEGVRAELIDGDLYMMASPLRRHQAIAMEIGRQLANFLKGKPCKVYPAPFGVRLSEAEDTVLEPDVVVVCDSSKLDDKGCNGAPDMVVEVLSPNSARIDTILKFNKYLSAGVREYWIIDPMLNTVHVCLLEDGSYRTTVHNDTGFAPVSVLPGCEIDLKELFAE